MTERRPLIATYMMASRPFGVIYIGVTSNLYRRATEHRLGRVEGFTRKRGCGLLVWYQPFALVVTALWREKALKRWNRAWKMQLVEQRNPGWADLYPWLCAGAPDPRLPDDDDCGVAAFPARREAGLDD